MSSNIWLSEQELSEVSIGNGETKMVPKEQKVNTAPYLCTMANNSYRFWADLHIDGHV
jgi:hypothetical protein